MAFRCVVRSSTNFLSQCLGSIRTKHSKRQIKRFMAPRHPAALRKLGRPTPPKLPEPQFSPIIDTPELLPNGWSKPLENRPEYPFTIARTKNKPMDAVGFLPVYSKKRYVAIHEVQGVSNSSLVRKDGTKVITRVKKVSGDRNAFLQEVKAVLQTPKPIRISAGGTIEIPGSHVMKLKRWLTSLGF